MRFFGTLLVAILAVAVGGNAPGSQDMSEVRFMDLEYFDRNEVDELLQEAAANEQRMHSLEQSLEASFQSLPKTTDGLLTHHAVRYILHRFFLHTHGWLVKGLEPEGAYKSQPAVVQKDWESWVPSYLQQHFDQLENHRGVNLNELAQMVAVIEDLVRKESHRQMAKVYESLGLSQSDLLTPDDSDIALDMYLIVVLTARNITMAEPEKNRQRLQAFQQRYSAYKEMHGWIRDLGMRYTLPDIEDQGGITFTAMSRVAEAFGDEFPHFNDKECNDLKNTMVKMEGGSRKPGRIPLADFYNNSAYRHWKFSENPEYLRDLGALDESDAKRPYVILANYISSFNNCIRADGLYAICCRSPCEQLMHTLEEQVLAPTADSATLAKIVASLSTDTMPARDQLDTKLVERLDGIAAQSGQDQMVPLHGRLFALWMHHAFPRECPYPHKVGTTNPQTPDEWMKTTGRSAQVSPEEIDQIVKDTCPAGINGGLPSHCEMEDAELPWSDYEDRENLLSSVHSPAAKLNFAPKTEAQALTTSALCLHVATLPVVLLFMYILDKRLEGTGTKQRRCYPSLIPAMAFLWATVLLWLLNVVNVKAAAGAGTVFLLWRLLLCWLLPSSSKRIDSEV